MLRSIAWIALATVAVAQTPDDVPPAPSAQGERTLSLEERVAELEAQMAKEKSESWKVYWKDGMRYDSPDGRNKIRWGGRLLLDAGWFDGQSGYPGDLADGAEIRMFRLYVAGTVWDNVEFRTQVELGAKTKFKDMYIGLVETPVGGIRVGQFWEPFSLEEQTSFNYITFMERSSAVQAISPSRQIGVMLHDCVFDQRATWAAGVFKPETSVGSARGDGDYDVTARITGTAWYANEGADVLHLGLASSVQSDAVNMMEFASNPGVNMVGDVVVADFDGVTYVADGALLWGGELAWIRGPFSLQSEYLFAQVDQENRPDADYWGWYVYGSWFLTGEHRTYARETGSFGRTVPKSDFGKGGKGAWEVAARYSMLDLSDPNGPSLDNLGDVTLGLNWYLNRNTRIMLNYVRSMYEADPVEADANLFAVRFQIDF